MKLRVQQVKGSIKINFLSLDLYSFLNKWFHTKKLVNKTSEQLYIIKVLFLIQAEIMGKQ